MFELTPFPNANQIIFKEKFVERYSKLTDWEIYKKYSLSFLKKSIRINTLKISIEDLKERLGKYWNLKQIPWCKEGFWIEHKQGRLDVGNTIEHALGYYYVQEAASMIPPLVLEPQENEIILDMCAAPGSKTSQIAQMVNNTGILMANDDKGMRLASLGINLQRIGATNTVITLGKGENLRGMQFDRILLDAPCSGTGTIRKSVKTLLMWNPMTIKHLQSTQKRLILTAFSLLKPGGVLVYSTCSSEPEENEEVVDYLLSKESSAKVYEIDLPIKRTPAVEEFEGKKYNPEVKKCLRIWPQDNDTDGFFVAKIGND